MINRIGLTSMDGVPENMILMVPKRSMCEVFHTKMRCKPSRGDPSSLTILCTRANARITPWKYPAPLKCFNVLSLKMYGPFFESWDSSVLQRARGGGVYIASKPIGTSTRAQGNCLRYWEMFHLPISQANWAPPTIANNRPNCGRLLVWRLN